MNKTTPLWIVIVILSSVIFGFAYKFIVLGNTAPGDDGRTAVVLTKSERQAVLEEMRTLLIASQRVVLALANEDMQAVVDAATPVGSDAISTVDFNLRAKLPLAFKKLGFATHHAFDDIATMAREGKPTAEIQLKLADTMNNCIACHASFQLPEAD